MTWIILLAPLAHAEVSFVTAVDPPVQVGVDGRHARPFQGTDGAWHLGHGRSGRFHDIVLDGDLVAQPDTARILIDGGGQFVDHGLAVCPDGSLLHAASGNLVQPDDSAWVTLVSADLEPGPTQLLIDREPEMSTNDMAAVCTEDLRAVAFAGSGDWELEIPQENWLYRITDDVLEGAAAERLPLHEASRINGTSLVWDAVSQQLLVIAMPGSGSLQVAFYNDALEPAGRVNAQVLLDDGAQGYWSSAAAPLGDGYAIVHMGRRLDQGFAQDTGDVFLTVTDRSFFFLHTVRLTNLDPPNGAMRPGIAVNGDELLIAWDRDGRFEATRAWVDLDALAEVAEAVPQDSGQPDEPGHATTPEAPPTSGTSSAGSGGCSSAPLPTRLLWLAPLLLWRRR